MKVLTVVGNRPQFIKSGPLSAALAAAGVEEIGLHTGQHWDSDLSDVFYDELGLPQPRYRLDLHTADAEAMRPRIAEAIERERPDWTIVFGDTNSTRAGTEASGDSGVRVAHIEAGLRSGDLSMPEEHNRIAVDAAAALLLCPDERSREILLAEGVGGRIEVVGDVMADACFRFEPIARERSTVLRRHELAPGGYVAATIHREANVRPERLARIIDGLGRIGERVVFPAHPRTRAALRLVASSAKPTMPSQKSMGELGDLPANVEILSPLGYLDMAALVSQARVLVTDSGGLQKEAYWYGVPCVTARPSTEWKDTVELGANVLVDDDPDKLAAAVAAARMPDERPTLYGDGHAAERVVASLAAA
ncbi:MAG TPA: UDP-N-acetylglucosamine 2-epimerase (non-hydrolyzing) [Gaiellaceae bacterium]|nr:UDP-N-acetylglucosamine 2-epimerase (non-hydrolyzing) [Gaiellaceae bacterium]